MNTESLKTFILLSDIKNYTQTANRLFIAQSTVSNRIIELENEIGKSLFIRGRKQLQLTQEGEHFLTYAKRIIELEDCAISEISTLNSFDGSIRIGSTNTIYDCHLVNKLLSFVNKNPNIKVDITISHSLTLIQMVQDRIIDIAFTYVPYNKNGIDCVLFTTDTLCLVTSNKNTEYKKGITQNELSMIPYYYCDFTFQDLGSYIKDLFPKGHQFPLVIDRSGNLLPFLFSGRGYSFLPKSIVQDSLNAGTLIEIPLLDFSVPPISCYILKSKNDKTSGIVDTLIT